MTKRGSENRRRAAAWLLSFVMLLSGSLSSPAPAGEEEPVLMQTESADGAGLFGEEADAWVQFPAGEEAASEKTLRDETGDALIEEVLTEEEWPDAEADLFYSEEELPDAKTRTPGDEEGWQDSMEAETASYDSLIEDEPLPEVLPGELLPGGNISGELLQDPEELQTVTDVWVNPVYENVVDPEDLIPDEKVLQQENEEVYQAAQETAALLEDQLGPAETPDQAARETGGMTIPEGVEEPDEEIIFEGSEETAYFDAQDLLASEGYYFTDQTNALAQQFREYLKSRTVRFSVGMAGNVTTDGALYAAKTALLRAMEHTGEPTEGDYIRYQMGGYYSALHKFTYRETEFYQITYTITYYTNAEQERAVDAVVSALLPSMRTGNAYSRIMATYRHLTSSVKYDSRASSNPDYLLMYTGYGALVDHSAVCQGYAVALYRLLLEMGIDCRIVDGKGVSASGKRTEEHAWNIIRIGNSYYNADATWDAGASPSFWDWFLKGNTSTDFGRHVPQDKFTTGAFPAAYPMSGQNYGGSASACPGHTSHASKYAAAVPPSCETVGYTQGTVCAYCGLTLSGREKISPTGHSWSAWETATPPSISAPGLQVRICTRCSRLQHRYTDKASPFITLSVKKATITLRRGRTRKIKVSCANGDRVVRYRSSRPKVVTVTKKGKLKAKKKGTARITVTLLSGLKKSFRVRVR